MLAEIPACARGLRLYPAGDPDLQIVGTRAVLNVLTGERHKTTVKETRHSERRIRPHPGAGERRVTGPRAEGGAPVTCRPADLLKPNWLNWKRTSGAVRRRRGYRRENAIDDVLTVALFPQIGLKFLENRHNPAAFAGTAGGSRAAGGKSREACRPVSTPEVEGKAFVVKVSDGGDISQLTTAVLAASSAPVQAAAPAGAGTPVTAPLAGNIWKVIAAEGQTVAEGDVLLILLLAKCPEIRAAQADGTRYRGEVRGRNPVGDTPMTLA